MARSSTLERRIVAMLNPRLERAALSRRAVALTVLMLIAITLPIAAMRGAQTPLPLTICVYDATGAVMPGVELALENATHKMTATAATDASGRYVFDPVPPGTYDLQAKLPGFKVLRQTFELKNAKDWDRALTLGVGDLQETIVVRASATPSGTPRATSDAPTRIRVGGNIRAPMKLNEVLPVYPDSMREEGREGVVVMDGVIGRDGTVTSVRVLSAQVHPDFAIAAVEAVRQWRFSPTLLNGKPVEVVMTVSVNFSLDQ
jgi:TonB family protein